MFVGGRIYFAVKDCRRLGVSTVNSPTCSVLADDEGGHDHHPNLGNDFGNKLSMQKSRTTELSETTMPTALVTALMLAASNVTACRDQRNVHLRGHRVKVAARGKYNSFMTYTNPPSNWANSLMVPRRLRLATWREDSGWPSNGSKIKARDLASTASSSPSVNNVPMRLPSRPLASNLDGKRNQRLKNFRIVFRYFAKNTLKHVSRSRVR